MGGEASTFWPCSFSGGTRRVPLSSNGSETLVSTRQGELCNTVHAPESRCIRRREFPQQLSVPLTSWQSEQGRYTGCDADQHLCTACWHERVATSWCGRLGATATWPCCTWLRTPLEACIAHGTDTRSELASSLVTSAQPTCLSSARCNSPHSGWRAELQTRVAINLSTACTGSGRRGIRPSQQVPTCLVIAVATNQRLSRGSITRLWCKLGQ
mmetsp:Transcript_41311/g.81557  ORF Transcript_41311/g.81557 Transcript_41311/m.81557 type:complete len:213 (-) Transcript_41311:267-905(-)